MALAQHHGLPTRLLDWSLNPLTSLFFACKPSPRGKVDGVVYAIEPQHFKYLDDLRAESPLEDYSDPFSMDQVCFLQPPILADRIRSQKGLFSVHPNPEKNFSSKKIERFVIPAEHKPDFLRNLFGLGIDAGFLMADLDGMCATLRWRSENGAIR